MVESSSKVIGQIRNDTIEDNGDVIALKDGKIEGFHIISTGTDTEALRMVGALGEMLYEQIKKTFGVNSIFVVAQHKDFRLIMFPRKAGFAVWKTNLDVPKIISALRQNEEDR